MLAAMACTPARYAVPQWPSQASAAPSYRTCGTHREAGPYDSKPAHRTLALTFVILVQLQLFLHRYRSAPDRPSGGKHLRIADARATRLTIARVMGRSWANLCYEISLS